MYGKCGYIFIFLLTDSRIFLAFVSFWYSFTRPAKDKNNIQKIFIF